MKLIHPFLRIFPQQLLAKKITYNDKKNMIIPEKKMIQLNPKPKRTPIRITGLLLFATFPTDGFPTQPTHISYGSIPDQDPSRHAGELVP